MLQWRLEKSTRYCIIDLPDKWPSIVETKLKCKENAGIFEPLSRWWYRSGGLLLNPRLKLALALPPAAPSHRQSPEGPPSAKIDQLGRKVQISHLFRLGWPAVGWQWWHASFASHVRAKPQLPESAIGVRSERWLLRNVLRKASNYCLFKESDAASDPP